jgi:estrogen-related receptor beta like 1
METNREADNDGNQVPNMTIIKMEEIMDKLKLLDYEIGFCKKLKFRPFPRHYFALATNSGEQFYYFSNVSVYLLNLCGCNLPQPQEVTTPIVPH